MEIHDEIDSHFTETESLSVQKPDRTDKESHTKVLMEHGIDPKKSLTPLQVIMMYKKGSLLPEKRPRKNSSDGPDIKVPRKKFEQLSI